MNPARVTEPWMERTAMLLGSGGVERLLSARVVVVGTGGVGAVAAEMLVRSGIGHIALVDPDVVSETNLNRQLPALHSTVGRLKVDVLGDRLKDINPDLELVKIPEFIDETNQEALVLHAFGEQAPDFVVDAIDTLSPKVALALLCLGSGIPLVSSMGSGAKTDATQVRLADISKTYECPLARMMRKRLRKEGVEKGFLAVFSPEIPDKTGMVIEESRNKKSQVGTVSYLPAVFGCVCAQAVVTRIAGVG